MEDDCDFDAQPWQVRIREDGKEEIATVTTTGELYKMKWDKLGDDRHPATFVSFVQLYDQTVN